MRSAAHPKRDPLTYVFALVILPLLGSLQAGLLGRFLRARGAAIVTTDCVAMSALLRHTSFCCPMQVIWAQYRGKVLQVAEAGAHLMSSL